MTSSWTEQALEWKRKGNRAFQDQNEGLAIRHYTEGITLCENHMTNNEDQPRSAVLLRISLLWNRAMSAFFHTNNDYQACIKDCNTALAYYYQHTKVDDPTTTPAIDRAVKSIIEKLLFRRAKAYFMQFFTQTLYTSMPYAPPMPSAAASFLPAPEIVFRMIEKDVTQLLQMDKSSKHGKLLLQTIQRYIKAQQNGTPLINEVMIDMNKDHFAGKYDEVDTTFIAVTVAPTAATAAGAST